MTDLPKLKSVGSKELLPDPEGLITAIGKIGYSIEEALADLVDNSVDAKAKNVLVRIFRDSEKLLRVGIADDGHGMDGEKLDIAMGFGSKSGKTNAQLGKYGMGLKSASFSQCSSVTVISRFNGSVDGRRWTENNIKKGWICEHVDPKEARDHMDKNTGQINTSKKGTLVYWDDLEDFKIAKGRADQVLNKIFKKVSNHLGLHFHRFIESGTLRIWLDSYNTDTEEEGLSVPVNPLNPFSYARTGKRGYPKDFIIEMRDIGEMVLQAHIWPPKSDLDGYKLGGGKVSRRQGFYFYRNNRLIQAGGWNGLRDDAEPHMSLARIAIDLPAKYDKEFGLNVQKSSVDVPEQFIDAVEHGKAGNTKFSDYIAAADEVYRDRNSDNQPKTVFALGEGVNGKLTKFFKKKLRKRDTLLEIHFSWKKLTAKEVFRLDIENQKILLNKQYRDAINRYNRASKNDAPLLKPLLFLLLKDYFQKERVSKKQQDELTMIQQVLLLSLSGIRE